MRAGPEREAQQLRLSQRRLVRPSAPMASTGAVDPSRVVAEEARPILLYGWDDTNDEMIAFGMVGGQVGAHVGNPTRP